MIYLLSLETATTSCSVALHRDDQLLAVQDFYLEKSHSSLLHPLIKNMLSYCEVERRELSAVAISKGPGSYTGLRIGTSAAKGLCFALDIPLIGVDTLEAMAYTVQRFNNESALVCPMLDARRMEVYCQIRNADGEEIMKTQPVIVDEKSFSPYLKKQKVWFFGDGSNKCRHFLSGVFENAFFIEGIKPSASAVGVIARRKYEKQQFEDLAYFVPNYLKEYRVTKPKKQ